MQALVGCDSTLRGDRRHRKSRDLRRVLRRWVIDAEIENNHFEWAGERVNIIADYNESLHPN